MSNIPITNGNGKISFDELSEEVLKILREGSSKDKVIDEKYKIVDTTGAFEIFGLGSEFTLIELLTAVAEKTKIIEQIEIYVKETIESDYERRFALLERGLQLAQSDIEFLKKFGGGIDPGDADAEYSTNRNDYTVNEYENELGLQVGDHEIKIPTDMYVSTTRLTTSNDKLTNLRNYISTNYKNLAQIEEMNSNVEKYTN